jgi:aspartokinase-like uncharacterized kinase
MTREKIMETPDVYPNREHRNADMAAHRRAVKALDQIGEHAAELRRRVTNGQADAESAMPLAATVAQLGGYLAQLETLRDVREWHEADRAEGKA